VGIKKQHKVVAAAQSISSGMLMMPVLHSKTPKIMLTLLVLLNQNSEEETTWNAG
jgi:hypothetical protein